MYCSDIVCCSLDTFAKKTLICASDLHIKENVKKYTVTINTPILFTVSLSCYVFLSFCVLTLVNDLNSCIWMFIRSWACVFSPALRAPLSGYACVTLMRFPFSQGLPFVIKIDNLSSVHRCGYIHLKTTFVSPHRQPNQQKALPISASFHLSRFGPTQPRSWWQMLPQHLLYNVATPFVQVCFIQE